MRFAWVVLGLSLLLPMVSSFVTYIFISMLTKPIALDTTQATILCLALMKMALLASTGIFPVNMDLLFEQVFGTGTYPSDDDATTTEVPLEEPDLDADPRSERDRRAVDSAGNIFTPFLYKVPDVAKTPCLRRFLCEIETVIRTSDDFENKPSENDADRHPEEEVDVESSDPQIELYTEAVRALYGYDSPSAPDSSPATERALSLMQSLTGKSCEEAYKLCSGWYTAPMVFKVVFDELGFRAKDEL
ncbi:uncharacterized protein LOC108668681 [Hyalella azteca]|uniref:Uncharacterized protein LOC108668681 n=1 Tax=Hyalella azteca TaxID=294128 RepID=A0A8B7NCU6_HYAAZ|nr:uncharacterized protein LOC108668681 [Hyalella azteca]